jgi:signal transduction histidine kinase
MTKALSSISLQSRIVKNIVALSMITVLAISLIIIFIVNKQMNENLSSQTIAWGNNLANHSAKYLISENDNIQKKLKDEFKTLITSTIINRVHVYSIKADNSTVFFTSYNRNNRFPAIGHKISEISKLKKIQFNDTNLELIVNIEKDGELLGYLFIQTSRLEKQQLITKLYFVLISFMLLTALIAIAIAQRLFNRINDPLTALIEDVGVIPQNKSYKLSLAKQPYKELDFLAKTINIFLARTDKHIVKLIDEHQHSLSKTKALEERLSARTNALKDSNHELLSTLEKLHEFQSQLVETEKMASLGDMVAGIAHEVNTPIGLGVTASSLLSDKLSEIKHAFENKTLKSSQLKKFLTDSNESVAIIFRNLERAAKLISSFKKVAVDQSSEENRIFNVNDLVNEVVVTLSAKLESNNVNLSVNCPEDFIINSKPGPINQILINLILNSIHHAFEGKDNRNITIIVMNLSDQLHLNFTDNGNGIDDSIKEKIFDPFTTTKRGSGGSGLGMHLVYNLVTQALDGHIALEDHFSQGVTFDITFPVELAAS